MNLPLKKGSRTPSEGCIFQEHLESLGGVLSMLPMENLSPRINSAFVEITTVLHLVFEDTSSLLDWCD